MRFAALYWWTLVSPNISLRSGNVHWHRARSGAVWKSRRPSLIVRIVSVDVKQHLKKKVLSELRNCVKVEVAVLGPPSIISLYSLCGRKAALNINTNTEVASAFTTFRSRRLYSRTVWFRNSLQIIILRRTMCALHPVLSFCPYVMCSIFPWCLIF